MARTIRERLATAVGQLKEAGHYDSAAAVEAVAAPRGYLLLRKDETRASASNLSITLDAKLKQAIQDAGEEYSVVLSGLAEEAYRRVIQEGWVPPKMNRNPRTKTVLNVKVDDELRQQVRGMLPALTEDAGYRVSEGNIVLSHICEELGIERAVDQDWVNTRAPKELVEHFEREAAAQGVTLGQVVEEGVRAFLDGEWTPERNAYLSGEKRGPRTRSWSEASRKGLAVRIDRTLLADMREKAEELSDESEYLVHPGGIVRAILTDRFGEPAE